MWYWAVLLTVAVGILYAYSVSSRIAISDKVGCSSCPSQKNEL